MHAVSRGAIAALVLGITSCGGSSDTVTTTPPAPVLGSIVINLVASGLVVGSTMTATVTGYAQAGGIIDAGTITWVSSAPNVATVSSAGLITGIAAGQSIITATTSSGKQASATVSVVALVGATGVSDYSIVDAQFTQGIQAADGSIPMVLGSRAAVVNVLLRSLVPVTRPMQLVLRLFDAGGTLLRSDTVVASGPLGSAPTYTAPSAQFLVPASVLAAGVRWQVVRDPRKLVPDDTAANDVFPRTGTAALSTVNVPPLTIRFVPIVLGAYGNATGVVNTANLSDYLRTLTSVHPLGTISAHVGAPVTTNASNFGTAPAGGVQAFWVQVLGELDLARIADPTEPDANWYGVVAPPTGYNNVAFGGFSYIPTSGANSGAGTRTSVAVETGWFSRPTQARDLVAHEIGHTFGRSHTPCGAPSGIDPAYPLPSGTLEQDGHDVFAWATGLSTSAATVPASTGDVMGYCFPVWASAYTYRGVMSFRGTGAVIAARAPSPMTRVLVVRGDVAGDGRITLEPTFAITGHPSLPDHPGAYTLQGLDASGAVLFSYAFDPFVLDHASDVKPFTIALPSTPDLEARLQSIVVRGRGATQRNDRAPTRPASPLAAPALTSALREAGGSLRVSCADSSARGIVAISGATGGVLGSASQSWMRLMAAPGTAISVSCSDGVFTQQAQLVAP